MDSCRDMEVYLSLKLDGMLEPEEARALEEHLALCPRCRALERELSAIHTALPELEEYEAPQGFARGVMERVEALERKPRVVPLFRRPQVRALMGLAACAVLCVGLYRGGLFAREGVNLDAVVYSGADASAGQSGETEGTGALQAEQPLPADNGAQPRDMAPATAPDTDGESAQTPEEVQESAASDGAADPDKQQTAPAAGDAEQPDVQPSQYQVGVQAAAGPAGDGQAVTATLVLDRLPQGGEEVLGGAPEWYADEAGRTCCAVTAGQLEQLEELAGQQGITAALEGLAEEDQSCVLAVLQAP